jgi:hypothetical protein
MRAYRPIASSCLMVFLLLLLLHGKPYYAGPIYPVLFAAGAAALDQASRQVQWGAGVFILGFGLLALPFGLPILPPAAMASFAARFGPKAATMTNQGQFLALPQDYADMIGWPAQVAAMAEAYQSLPPDQRAQAILVASNYGQAGALEFFGPALGLRAPVWLPGSPKWWQPTGRLPEVVVAIGFSPDSTPRYFRTVQLISQFDHPWMVAEERHTPIVIAQSPLPDLQAVWSRSK